MDVEQFLDQPTLGFFLNGAFFHEEHHKTEPLFSPCTNAHWKTLIQATSKDAENAIHAAHTAFSQWKNTPAPKRAHYLRKIGDYLLEYQETFAKIFAMEMGKPISQGKAEVVYSAGYFHWFCGEAERIYGQTIPSQFSDKELLIQYEPVGVCALITPWNFPLAMAARKIAAALAAGCTVINKPSAESPVSMLLFAQICQMAELPAGVVNILPGPEVEIGSTLMNSPLVRKVSFTGSTEVGKLLYRQSAETLKKLTLELGGNAPLIVFDDANFENAVKGAVASKFRNNGQTCVCPNRIFVQESIYSKFLTAFVETVKQLKLGDPLDPQSEMSTILHSSVQEKVVQQIEDAIEKGAFPSLQGTTLYEPCVLSNVTQEMRVYQEETFGPIAPLISFKTEDEAITMANNTPYGLASYLFTENLSRAKRVADQLEFGIIGINDPIPSTYQASFGGIHQSGFGREGGPTGIKEYLVEKYISYQFT